MDSREKRRHLRPARHQPGRVAAWLLSSLLGSAPQPALAQSAGFDPPRELVAQRPPDWAEELPAIREGRATLVQAEPLVRYLGLVSSAEGLTLTLRSPEGILTLFQDSPDFLWQPVDGGGAREESLSAAVRRIRGEWWLPADVLAYLGLWLGDGIAEGGDGIALRLVFPDPPPVAGRDGELVDLGSGVPGLRMFRGGSAGPASQSLLLADAGLLGLALPSQQARFDDLVARSGSDRPLLVVVTAMVEGPWDAVIQFSQGAHSVEARHPFRLRLLQGQAALVGPGSPVIAIALLPRGFNLREPIVVQWGETSATVTFRR